MLFNSNRLKNTIQHIFFDLDHTLWDFDTNSALAFDRIFKSNYPGIITQQFLEKYIPINQACWRLYEVDKITHEALRYQRLKQSFDAVGYAISDDQIEKIAQDYIQYLPEYNHLFEDAIDTLNYLKDKYELHIITNGFAQVQFKKINNSNLTHYFKTVTNSEMAGAKKPSPIIFQHALHLANADKKQSIMIGDSIQADVIGAQDFGMRAIFFNPNREEAAADIIQIATLAELKTIF